MKYLENLARIFVREPVQWAGLAASLLQLLSLTAFPGLTPGQQGALDAVVVAVAGLAAAWGVSAEKAAPFVAGLVQAGISCALAFGLSLPAEIQTAIMALVSAGVAFVVRSQVVAHGAVGGGRHEARL